MTDLTHRGTYLKKRVLIPAILNCVDSRYRREGKILDAGCGEGVLFRELAARYDNVYGVDCVELFIRRLASEYPNLRSRLATVDIVEDDFDERFEVVIASALLLSIPDIDRALERLIQLVAPGGMLIIADVCARLHRSIGYHKGTELIQVHDPSAIHHFEKNVGGGQTIAVHNYHPPGYYRRCLEAMGAECLVDREILASREAILADPMLSADQRKIVLEKMSNDLVNPTFFLLAMSRTMVV
jgi:trans-aconitate methyltransferase